MVSGSHCEPVKKSIGDTSKKNNRLLANNIKKIPASKTMVSMPVPLKIILNKAFITGIISSVSFIISSLLIKNETEKLKYLGIVFNPKGYRIYLKISAVCLLYLTGFLEVIHHSSNYFYSAYTTSIVTFSYHLIFFSLLDYCI
mgnify:CR=1 FL=1